MEEEIRSEFEQSGFSIDSEASAALQRCLTFCINYNLSPSDLISHWEVYYLNRQLSGLNIEEAHIDGFLAHVQNELKERTIKEEPGLHIYSSSDVEMLLNDEHESIKEGFLDTPSGHYERSFTEQIITSPTDGIPSSNKDFKSNNNRITPFSQRKNKFASQFALNSQQEDKANGGVKTDQASENIEDDIIRRVRPNERCSLQVHKSWPHPGCKFMYDRIEDRFNFLENRIKRHADAFNGSGCYGELVDPTLASQKSVFTVGMVCCDGEGHLNEKSTLLQGSVELSGGQRVRLDLQKSEQFSLFPGQVIGIEGHNPSGHCLVASKIIQFFPGNVKFEERLSKKPAIDPENLQSTPSSSTRVISLVVAAGPFTTSDNLYFEPLAELLAYARKKPPQLLILMGPFVDSEHPEIKKGTVDRSFDDMFNAEILTKVHDYANFMGSAARVILVPSIRDANHDFVFPQPAFDMHINEETRHQITCLANPCLFSANEIMIGCCSVDIVKHLSSEEISRTPVDAPSWDRMGRLATHILSQRSFYPLYPPSVTVPLDFLLASEALELPSVPDILLLSSDLSPFVKVLSVGSGEVAEQCLGVNPGRLAKGIGGGTFVEINYNGDPDKTIANIIRI